MALSADASYTTQDYDRRGNMPMVVKASSVVYNGALCSHDTTAGEIKPFDGTQGDRLVGFHFGDTVTGNSSAPRTKAQIRPGGFAFIDLTVGGLANTSADYGKPVWATDDGTFSVTDAGTGGSEVGFVMADDSRSTGKAKVFIRPDIFARIDS